MRRIVSEDRPNLPFSVSEDNEFGVFGGLGGFLHEGFPPEPPLISFLHGKLPTLDSTCLLPPFSLPTSSIAKQNMDSEKDLVR